jgi:hypothetical protein
MNRKKDEKAPEYLTLEISHNGKPWGTIHAIAKEYSTGSAGFYGVGKIINPENPKARYQVNTNLILIGSKPKK